MQGAFANISIPSHLESKSIIVLQQGCRLSKIVWRRNPLAYSKFMFWSLSWCKLNTFLDISHTEFPPLALSLFFLKACPSLLCAAHSSSCWIIIESDSSLCCKYEIILCFWDKIKRVRRERLHICFCYSHVLVSTNVIYSTLSLTSI